MPEIRAPRFEGTLQLAPGRRLGYAEFGPTDGKPVLWFHGTPGARRQIAPQAREAAYERSVRIIAVERPGIGDSTPHVYSSFVEWAGDIERFCEALELERVGIAGLSGGGPYALACAHELPDRVTAVAVLGGVAPSVGSEAAEGGTSPLTRRLSPLLGATYGPLGGAMRRLVLALEPWGDEAIDLFARFMPPGDKRVFADANVRAMFQDDLLNGSRRQMMAFLLDARLFGRPWGFSLRDIEVPVHMWYGDADNIVPVAHGEHMAKYIPGAILRIRRGEGHLGGLGISHEIFDAIASASPE